MQLSIFNMLPFSYLRSELWPEMLDEDGGKSSTGAGHPSDDFGGHFLVPLY